MPTNVLHFGQVSFLGSRSYLPRALLSMHDPHLQLVTMSDKKTVGDLRRVGMALGLFTGL